MAAGTTLSRVLIVNDSDAVKGAVLTEQLSKTFKIRLGKVDADYVVPGMFTVAFCVVPESAVRFACFREPVIERSLFVFSDFGSQFS